jgi:hypothetical protein
MVIWCDNIDTKEDFLEKDFNDQIFLWTFNYNFFLLSLVFFL